MRDEVDICAIPAPFFLSFFLVEHGVRPCTVREMCAAHGCAAAGYTHFSRAHSLWSFPRAERWMHPRGASPRLVFGTCGWIYAFFYCRRCVLTGRIVRLTVLSCVPRLSSTLFPLVISIRGGDADDPTWPITVLPASGACPCASWLSAAIISCPVTVCAKIWNSSLACEGYVDFLFGKTFFLATWPG
jgi:hypothetical protein